MRRTLRPYQESFEPEISHTIERLIDELEDLGKSPMGYGRYTSETASCLSVGLLLAAVSVSTALLEIFLRDITVAYRIESRFGGDIGMRNQIETTLESDRQFGFNEMLKELRLPAVSRLARLR